MNRLLNDQAALRIAFLAVMLSAFVGGCERADGVLSESEVVVIANGTAVDLGYDLDALDRSIRRSGSSYRVNYAPEPIRGFGGGLTIVVDAANGEVVEVLRYQ